MNKDNITHNDIEFYLLNREYADLTNDEKKFVDEQISSEQEFNELKAILQGVNTVFTEEQELEPSPEIKAHLLKEFERNRPAGNFWLNSIGTTLFPKEKKLFRKPGIQLLAMAASVALLIGFGTNFDDLSTHKELAEHKQNEPLAPMEETIVPELEKGKASVEKDFAKEVGTDDIIVTDEETENEELAEGEFDMKIEQESLYMSSTGNNSPVLSESDKAAESGFANSETIVTNVENEVLDDDYRGRSEDNSGENLVISGNLDATTIPAYDVDEMIVSESKNNRNENANVASKSVSAVAPLKKDSPAKGRTLSEDAELIDLLYTAL